MQLPILVTLALTCSSALVTAHPILDTSIIVPRTSSTRPRSPPNLKRKRTDSDPSAGAHAAPPTQRPKLEVHDIVNLQGEYWSKPGVPVIPIVTFTALGIAHQAKVYGWKGIPNFVAYRLSSDQLAHKSHPQHGNPTLASWPVLVLAYTRHDPGSRQWSTFPVEEKRSQLPSNWEIGLEKLTWSRDDVTSLPHPELYPVLYAAAPDPPGYDVGTSVWRHLLSILQDEPRDGRYYWLIYQIAKANPDLSEMLYVDSKFQVKNRNTRISHPDNSHLSQSSRRRTKSLLKVIVSRPVPVNVPPAGTDGH